LHRRRASSAVATLAAGSASHHLQDGGADTQGPDDIGTIIPQQHAPHSGTSETLQSTAVPLLYMVPISSGPCV